MGSHPLSRAGTSASAATAAAAAAAAPAEDGDDTDEDRADVRRREEMRVIVLGIQDAIRNAPE
jgi:ribosomal protein L12E/L44/L45/RPP1/RPP2